MARVKNDPQRYVGRSDKLPRLNRKIAPCPKKTAEREQSYMDAPIDERFYINHRRHSNT